MTGRDRGPAAHLGDQLTLAATPHARRPQPGRLPPTGPRSWCAGTRFRWSRACTATLSGAARVGSNPAGGPPDHEPIRILTSQNGQPSGSPSTARMRQDLPRSDACRSPYTPQDLHQGSQASGREAGVRRQRRAWLRDRHSPNLGTASTRQGSTYEESGAGQQPAFLAAASSAPTGRPAVG